VNASTVRVFPSRTTATPYDPMAFVGDPPLFRPEAAEVHVSCAFTWDVPEARRLARAWGHYYPTVKIGGPAIDDPGGEFVPGKYLQPGNVITSRGCPNHCAFCFVPDREGPIRTLPIADGHILHDNNLLACPDSHIADVLTMLARQKHRPVFAGGLESRRVTKDFAKAIKPLKCRAFLAYDRPGDAKAVKQAAEILLAEIGHESDHWLSCFVLVGFKGDTMEAAEGRLRYVLDMGLTPLAMYYLPKTAKSRTAPPPWRKFVRSWARPAAVWSQKNTAQPLDGHGG